MTDVPNWKIPASPAATPEGVSQPNAPDDALIASLGVPDFSTTAPPISAGSRAVAPLPVAAVDPGCQALHAALQSGAIPTFDDQSPAAHLPVPLDIAAEREAYAVFVHFIQQHASPGTTITFVNPDDFAAGLS